MSSFDLSNKPLIGMIHLPRLNDSDYSNLENVIEFVLEEVNKLEEAEFSAIMIENFNDTPFPKERVSDELFAKMVTISSELKKYSALPLGVNILRNACLQAYSLANALEFDFIRCNIFESAYVTDQGIIEGAAYNLSELKGRLNSNVKILADIHVKHAHPLVNFSILESAHNALERGNADAVIVSGIATGRAPDIEDFSMLTEEDIFPILGSGLSIDNIETFFPIIRGAIIGTSIKRDRKIHNPIDSNFAKTLSNKWNDLR